MIDAATGAPELGALTEMHDLPSGRGRVELERVITYGTRRRAVLALAHHRQTVDVELKLRADAELVVAMVRRFVGASGEVSPLSLDDVDTWPAGDVDDVFRRAAFLFREGTKGPTPKVEAS